MGLYKDGLGNVVEVADDYAATHGYKSYTTDEQISKGIIEGIESRGDDSLLGAIKTGVGGVASGLTLGISDMALGGLGTKNQNEEMLANIKANQNWRTGGEILGAVGGAFLGAGPAGFLSRGATEVAEQGLTRGGIGGTLQALGAYGVEGAVQNAGQYLGMAAISDREVTAEGLAGALGTGFAFSAGGSGVMLGLEKGTIAARRMFSKVMDGGGAASAATKWESRIDDVLKADSQTLTAAKQELASIEAAEQAALVARTRAGTFVKEERLYASRAVDDVPTSMADDVSRATPDAPTPRATPTPDVPDAPIISAELTARKEVLQEAIPDFEKMLERQLAATKQGLDDGLSLKDLNAKRADSANDMFNKQLEDAQFRVRDAGDDLERQAALDDLADLEKRTLTPDNHVDSIVKKAEELTGYEKASAKLTEAVGDGAHPLSKENAAAFRAAEDQALDQASRRTTRAIDDAETFGPAKMSSKERVGYAKERYAEADIAHAQVKTQKLEAKQAVKQAQADDAARRDAAGVVSLKGQPSTGNKTGFLGAAENLGSAAEVLNMVGVGVPSAADIPVIGPLLSTYLKFKAVGKALGGRVPATGEAKAAAFAAQTKDRIARSVDRMLGLVERTAPKLKQPAGIVGAALSRRIYDDGEADAKENASLQEKAAVRVRELAAYVSTPGAIEKDVRRELRDVSDPDLIEAVERHRRAAYEYLLKNAPKAPPNDPLSKKQWQPSAATSVSLGRRIAVVNDPEAALEAVNHLQVTLDHAETLKNVYPKLFQAAQERLMNRAAEIKSSLPYRTQVQASLLFDIPLASSLQPDNMAILQSSYQASPAPAPGMQGPQPAQPPVPSIAGGGNLTPLYQTSADRSALRR